MDLSLSEPNSDTSASSSAKSYLNFARKCTFLSLHHHLLRLKPKLQKALLHHFSAEQEIPRKQLHLGPTSPSSLKGKLHSCLLPHPPVSLGKCIQLEKTFPFPRRSFGWMLSSPSMAGGPGTSQHGGRAARATPWARGLWCL